MVHMFILLTWANFLNSAGVSIKFELAAGLSSVTNSIKSFSKNLSCTTLLKGKLLQAKEPAVFVGWLCLLKVLQWLVIKPMV